MILKVRVFGLVNSTTGSRVGPNNIAQPLVDRLFAGRTVEAKSAYETLRRGRGNLGNSEEVAGALEKQSAVNDPANVRIVLKKLLLELGVARYQAIKLGLPEAFGAFMTVGALTGIAEGGMKAAVGAVVGVVFAAATYGVHRFRSRVKTITLSRRDSELVDRILNDPSVVAGQATVIRMGQIRDMDRPR